MEYAGFWRRLGAFIVDLVILSPLGYLTYYGGEQARLFHVYSFIPGMVFALWFHVYLVKKYGGTPGKLLLNIKITKLDGSIVGYREACLRYIVDFLINKPIAFATIFLVVGMTDEFYFSMNPQERALYFANKIVWFNYVAIALQIWVWSEFIVMLTNKQRRALHDFIAGTIVILNKVPSQTENINSGSDFG